MGRYYEGDINGKFMFGIQSSDASERFGGEEILPNYTTYYFDKDDLESINSELKHIESCYQKEINIIKKYFEEKDCGPVKELHEVMNKSREEVKEYLRQYADYKLGLEIKECVEKQGYCEFTAEH